MFRKHLGFVAIAASLALAGSTAMAAPIVTLDDNNSQVRVDLGTDAGVYQWNVGTTNEMFQQWFWFRIGDTGGEQSISNLSLVSYKASDTNDNPGNDTVSARYRLAGSMDITVSLQLTGGLPGTGASDLAETISIHNTGTQVLPMHFFQYADLDLSGSLGQDSVSFPNANAVRQVSQDGTIANETVVTPAADHREIGVWPTIISQLLDNSPTTLSDNVNANVSGDVTWAYEWDRNIAPGGTLIISKDMNVVAQVPSNSPPVPLPASVWMGAVMLAGIGVRSIRRRLMA